MFMYAFLRLLLLLTLLRFPLYGSDGSVPWKSPKNLSDPRRVLLVISLSGLNADDPEIFSMPNMLHLRSHASYPSFFVPQYPGTGAPNLFSMVTGLYPESHGVLADKVYDPRRGKILTERDPGYFTQNSLTIPIWTLNEYHHGVSACIMWPGCEVTVAGHKPTYHVPKNDSYSFTDLVDLVVSFASAKFAEEDFVKFVAGRAFESVTVMKSAMVKSEDVNGMKETKHSGIEEEVLNVVEYGDKITGDEEIIQTENQSSEKTGDDEIIETEKHGDENAGAEIIQTEKHDDKKTGDGKIIQTQEHGDDKMNDEEIMEAVEHVGKKTDSEKIIVTVEDGGKKTGDEEIPETEKHGDKETGDDEIMETVDHSVKKTGDDEIMVTVEHSDNTTGRDEELTHGLEHSSNETANRSRRDLRRDYLRVKRHDSWPHHYMATDWKQRYSSASEEKYEVVRVATEDANNRIKHIIDAHDKTMQNDKNGILYETFEEAANRSSTGKQNFTWHPYPFFKNLARTRLMYTLEQKARANLVMVRFDEPAKTARRYGPHSPQMMAALHTLDIGLLYLHLQLQLHNLQHNTDVIIVSDHGTIPLGFKPSHTPPSKHRAADNRRNESNKGDIDYKKFIINLDSILDPSLYRISGETPLLHIWPKPGKHDEVHSRLANASAKHHFSVYGSQHLVYDAYHSSSNPRISKILLQAVTGYAFTDKIADRALAGPWECNISEGMPLMLAAGPSFRENFEGFTMQAVDLYPLMMEVLDIHDSPPVNGSFILPSFMLKIVPLVIYNASWIFAVMSVVILVLLAALISCCFRNAKQPDSPAPQRMSTIYRSTVEPDNSLVEYDVRVMTTTRGNRSRSASLDALDGARTTFTTARVGKGKAPPIPRQQGVEGEGDDTPDEPTNERTKLLITKASVENVK